MAGLPPNARDLTVEQAMVLQECFRQTVVNNRSSGDIAANFGDLVLYIVGDSSTLSELQKRLILTACAVVRRRPLPVLRWSQFVLSNLEHLQRIRFVLTACKISKGRLASRLGNVVRFALPELGLPESPRLLAIGYSGTVASIVRGISAVSPKPLLVFSPKLDLPGKLQPSGELLKEDLESGSDRIEVVVVPDDMVKDLCEKKQADLVIAGCKVIGRTARGTVEIVNSAPCVKLFREARELGLPVMVVAGLYKIWPTGFYEQHRQSTIDRETLNGDLYNATLREDEIDWIFTERGCFRAKDFGQNPTANAYFELEDLEVPCAINACTDDDKFISLTRDTKILSELAMEPDITRPRATPVHP